MHIENKEKKDAKFVLRDDDLGIVEATFRKCQFPIFSRKFTNNNLQIYISESGNKEMRTTEENYLYCQ